jgi:hypothetical protein
MLRWISLAIFPIHRNHVLKLLVHLGHLLLLLHHVVLACSLYGTVFGRVYLGVLPKWIFASLYEIALLILLKVLVEVLLAASIGTVIRCDLLAFLRL